MVTVINYASALIVIDMQHALYDGPAKPYNGEVVLTRIQALIEHARSSKVLVSFVQHCSPPGTPCERGSRGWKLLDELSPQAGDLMIEKTTPSIFYGTTLCNDLQNFGVSRIILAGMKTEYCIDTSCRVGLELGFRVVLASDAHTTVDNSFLSARSIIDHHNLTLGGPFADVRPADQITFT